MEPNISIAVLAGGKSRRMGRDKAELVIDGAPLLERTARIALATGLPVVVVGRTRPENWPLDAVTFVPDTLADHGPLGGLLTGLTASNEASVLLLACDLPLLTTPAVQWLVDRTIAFTGPHGLITENNERLEPLFSVYAAQCLPLVSERIAAGRLSMMGMIEAGEFGHVVAPRWITEQLVNVNTPEDFRAFTQKEPVDHKS